MQLDSLLCTKTIKIEWMGFSLTNNLRVIQHAWHFYYASVLVLKAVCGSIGILIIIVLSTSFIVVLELV